MGEHIGVCSLAGQTLFYLCIVTGAHIVYSRHGGSKEKVEGEELASSVSAVYCVGSCDYTQVEKSLASKTKESDLLVAWRP